MAVISRVITAALSAGILLFYAGGRYRHRVRYVPRPAPHWHDVGPEAAELRRRARRWRLVVLTRRGLLIAGGYLAFFFLVTRLREPDGDGSGAWYLLVPGSVVLGLALTPLCRRLAHPMYSPPRGSGARDRHSLSGSLARTGAGLIFYPVLVYLVPVVAALTAVPVLGLLSGSLDLLGLLAVAVGWLLLLAYARVLRRIDQWALRHRSPQVTAVLAADPRPYFLYLRTFQDDAVELRAGPVNRRGLITALSFRRRLPFEEVVAWRFQHFGPLVAGNDPSAAGLASLGAAKLFLSTFPRDRWKVEIEQYARASRAVVLSAAPVKLGDGFQYELQMIGERMPPHPLVLLVPPDRPWTPWTTIRSLLLRRPPQADVAERWGEFCCFVNGWPVFQGIYELNPTGAAHVLLYLPDEGWSVWGAAQRTEWTYAVAIMRAMAHAERGYPDRQVSPAIQPTAPHRPATPATVRWAIGLMVSAMLLYLPATVQLAHLVRRSEQLATYPQTVDSFAALLAVELTVSFAGWLPITWLCARGSARARSAATVALGIGFLVTLLVIGRIQGAGPRALTVLFLAPALASVVLLWRGESLRYFDPTREPPPTAPPPPAAEPPPLAEEPPPGTLPKLGPERHRTSWREVPRTVQAAVLLMAAGMAALTLAGYLLTFRLLHAAQAPAASTDDINGQLRQTSSALGAVAVALTAVIALACWVWVATQCRRGHPRGRVAATVTGSLMTVAASLRALLTPADLPLTACCAVLALTALTALLLLWHRGSKRHFATDQNEQQPRPPTRR
ncbi:hypothetical protein CFP65_7547 [Kitasatospora sp. MMS16-BH015]|uniref:hypothetical protein n=1 Tax=Kitasatospora sp. MMS16-BH015 TaxID=2018025 RepID=UPI000CA1ADBE|nr:hypothetical protein [Kitasatospora sp. MMS16-BH015]AUG82121.1 hypothetical protein CFP65_7547 [Kitasatospora sp. MMS16-BH015]